MLTRGFAISEGASSTSFPTNDSPLLRPCMESKSGKRLKTVWVSVRPPALISTTAAGFGSTSGTSINSPFTNLARKRNFSTLTTRSGPQGISWPTLAGRGMRQGAAPSFRWTNRLAPEDSSRSK